MRRSAAQRRARPAHQGVRSLNIRLRQLDVLQLQLRTRSRRRRLGVARLAAAGRGRGQAQGGVGGGPRLGDEKHAVGSLQRVHLALAVARRGALHHPVGAVHLRGSGRHMCGSGKQPAQGRANLQHGALHVCTSAAATAPTCRANSSWCRQAASPASATSSW